jgi:hypothetical protein
METELQTLALAAGPSGSQHPTKSLPSTFEVISVDDDDDDIVETAPPTTSMLYKNDRTRPRSESAGHAQDVYATERPVKKQRASSPNGITDTSTNTASISAVAFSSIKSSIYLGSFVCGNAFSAVKGKGYTAPGQEIVITRDDPDEDTPKASSSATGKGKTTPTTKKGGKKQLTLSNMTKPAFAKKKKVGMIVRITNTRGFGMIQSFLSSTREKLMGVTLEFGRLPQDIASWVSQLLDCGE